MALLAGFAENSIYTMKAKRLRLMLYVFHNYVFVNFWILLHKTKASSLTFIDW